MTTISSSNLLESDSGRPTVKASQKLRPAEFALAFIRLAFIAGCVTWLAACAVLAGGAAGAATGYVAGHEAAKD